LTRKEYELALFLFANEGRLVSRGHLLDMVWRRRASAESRTLDSHVSRVRRNLLLDRRRGFELVAVYGSGYRLDRCEEAVLTSSPARAGQYSGRRASAQGLRLRLRPVAGRSVIGLALRGKFVPQRFDPTLAVIHSAVRAHFDF
jgi:DNA-binding winged helix-turn-helix (wHTH) protein